MVQDDLKILRGDYMVYRFTDQIYKVVKFKSNLVPVHTDKHTDHEKYETKLDNSLSRTRRLILEKALCNPWSHFATLTIDPTKFDRYSLKDFYKVFSQWLRDYRKKGYEIKYLLVPEMHPTSGAWHLHGFFYGLPPLERFSSLIYSDHRIPLKLLYSNFEFWSEYSNKFGFSSFGKIRSPVRSAFYISKYITKDHEMLVSDLGAKMFYSSQKLNTPSVQMEVYGQTSTLDQFLQQEYQFCSVGMTKIQDGLSWDFALEFDSGHFTLFDDIDIQSTGAFFDDISSINEQFEQLTYITDAHGDINFMKGDSYNG